LNEGTRGLSIFQFEVKSSALKKRKRKHIKPSSSNHDSGGPTRKKTKGFLAGDWVEKEQWEEEKKARFAAYSLCFGPSILFCFWLHYISCMQHNIVLYHAFIKIH